VFRFGNREIRIDGESLYVDYKKYGTLKEGEPVLVDNDKVLVSGLERQGTLMSNQETLDFAIVKETTRKINGHQIVVRPGCSFVSYSKSRFGGRHKLIVGEREVVIKKDHLFVNGESYGELNASDSILVECKNVSIKRGSSIEDSFK
jgi:hypothetical protein